MKDELKSFENAVDTVLAPDRAVRWMVRIIVAIVIFGAGAVVLRIAWHMVGKVDQAVVEMETQEEVSALTHNSFVIKKDAIDACGLEIKAAREALARHLIDVDSRFISRESDRIETSRLNSAITSAQQTRLDLIRDYNERATRVAVTMLGDLPKHIDVIELPAPAGPEAN